MPTFDRQISLDDGSPEFSAYATAEGGCRVVRLVGELDMSTVELADLVCRSGSDTNVVADLSDVTFMDWRGYCGLAATRRTLQAGGGTLTLRNLVAQPARAREMFTRLLADVEV